MVPTAVPMELQNLTQIEEMLIARALPIMSVFIKPGGQRAYSGHCINFPQDIRQLASTLPHYPKEISIIVVRMKGNKKNIQRCQGKKTKSTRCFSMVDKQQSPIQASRNQSTKPKQPSR